MAYLLKQIAPSPPRGLKITGSNGKGSVSATCASILRAHGLRTGLFTSPHLYRPNERIQLNGVAITDVDLERWYQRVDQAAERIAPGAFGAFELWTAIAAGWLVEQGAEAVVWEAGIGGRLDPTRLLPAPVSALTNVSLEHTQLLGRTREAIAADKAQIADPGSRLIVGWDVPGFAQTPPQSTVALDMFALLGPHQRRNAQVALAACEAWLGDAYDPALAEHGLASTRWPLRFEQIGTAPPVWADVAHNVSGVRQVVATAKAMVRGPVTLIIGVSADRPVDDIVAEAALAADFAICTTARHKGASPEAIAAACPIAHQTAQTVAQALVLGQQRARDTGGSVLITGGLFLAAEAAWVLRGNDPATLCW